MVSGYKALSRRLTHIVRSNLSGTIYLSLLPTTINTLRLRIYTIVKDRQLQNLVDPLGNFLLRRRLSFPVSKRKITNTLYLDGTDRQLTMSNGNKVNSLKSLII